MKRNLKILLISVLIGVMLIFATNIYAAINMDYYQKITEGMKVVDVNLDAKLSDNILIDALAALIYGIGSLMEWILGAIFTAVTGTNIFPWADAILFNAIPLLDINVFNPSGASLVAGIKTFVSDTYWTVFSLAFSFLGIAIMVTAIKLAISTIASDKATYKQAIVKWIMGFIMLWGIHFFISFVLYLNEGLVKQASVQASAAIQNGNVDLNKLRAAQKADDQQLVQNFIDAMDDGNELNALEAIGNFLMMVGAIAVIVIVYKWTGGAALPIFSLVKAVAAIAIGNAIYVAGNEVPPSDFAGPLSQTIAHVRTAFVIDQFHGRDISKDAAKDKLVAQKDVYSTAAELLRNDDYIASLQATVGTKLTRDSEAFNIDGNGSIDALAYLYSDALTINRNVFTISQAKLDPKTGEPMVNKDGSVDAKNVEKTTVDNYVETVLKAYLKATDDLLSRGGTSDGGPIVKRTINSDGKNTTISPSDKSEEDVNYDEVLVKYCKAMVAVRESLAGDTTVDNQNPAAVISTLGKTFKEMAWQNTATSWRPSKISIQGALLYAIFVAQSLIFFIAYAKRLFYVVILILIAPVVVVYDFFTKFSS